MRVATARAQFMRVFWWLVFVALGLVAVPYALNRPPEQWLENALGKVVVLLGCALVCRVAAWRWPEQAVSALLMVFIGASPWFLGLNFNAFSVMAVANLPLVLLSMLWGWRGALLGIMTAMIGFATRTHAFDELIIAGLLLGGSGLIGGFIHRLTTALDRANQQLEMNNARLERSASTDAMTGLGNRRALSEEFAGFSRLGPMVLTLWDLNDLKRINDQRGHAAGDAFLLEFVGVLHAVSRAGDRYYRVGGDEFVGLHPKLEDGRLVIDRVLEHFTSVSVGWALVDGRGLESVMLEADTAMYEHKAKTKTGVFEKVILN